MKKYLENGDTLMLNNKLYTIEELIGHGAACAAYKASYDGKSCVLKEYNPCIVDVERDEQGNLFAVNEKSSDRYVLGKEKFKASIDMQKNIREKFSLKNQTPYVIDECDAYNTYYVETADYFGQTYEQILNDINLKTRIEICLAVTKLINNYHNEGFVCLDIKPSNIFVLPETTDIIEYIDYDSIQIESEILSNGYVSYSKEWAAPEQINPYEWKNISKKSDIYALGELIFFSCFSRHSHSSEHRRISTYPFDETDCDQLKTAIVQKYLTEIFRGTLRSAPDCRFSSLSRLIELLEELVKELSKEHLLIRQKICSNKHFVGREREIKEIEAALEDNSFVFVKGIGGIGKSELVKKYIKLHEREYDNIVFLTYEGSIEKTICSTSELNFTNLGDYFDEKERAKFKIRLLSEKLGTEDNNENKNIIVLDNFDICLYEISDNEIWQQMQRLNARFIVTTRNEQEDCLVIEINEMSADTELVELFCKYSGVKIVGDDLDYVKKIIQKVDGHTMIVELIAKHMKAAHINNYKEMYEKLVEYGVLGLEESRVIYHDKKDLIYNHINHLFMMDNLDYIQKMYLAEISLMPLTGVEHSAFVEFWKHKNNEIINFLIEHGWIKLIDNIITIHSIIRSSIIHLIKSNAELSGDIFFRASNSLISGLEDKYYVEYEYNKLLDLDPSVKDDLDYVFQHPHISQKTYREICDSLVYNIVINKITKHTYRFPMVYLYYFIEYGDNNQKVLLIDFLLKYKEDSFSREQLEYLYYYKVKLSLDIPERDEKSLVSICEKRLKIAEDKKEHYNISTWYTLLWKIFKNDEISSKKYMNLAAKNKKIAHKYGEEYPIIFQIAIKEWNEDLASMYYKFPFLKKQFYNLASEIRFMFEDSKDLHPTHNSTMAHIDMAKISLIKNRTDDAIIKLKRIVSFYEDNNYLSNSALLHAYKLLAHIEYNEKRFESAMRYIDVFLKRAEIMAIKDSEDLIEIHYILSSIYYEQNDIKNAEIEILKCYPVPEYVENELRREIKMLYFLILSCKKTNE